MSKIRVIVKKDKPVSEKDTKKTKNGPVAKKVPARNTVLKKAPAKKAVAKKAVAKKAPGRVVNSKVTSYQVDDPVTLVGRPPRKP